MNMHSQCVQIEDPLNPHNNVGKSSFKFFEIKYALQYAYSVAFIGCFCDCHNDRLHIERAIEKQHFLDPSLPTLNKRKCDSILSRIVYAYIQSNPK